MTWFLLSRRFGSALRGVVAVFVLAAVAVVATPGSGRAHDRPADRREAIAAEMHALRDQLREAEAQELELLARFRVSERRTEELEAAVASMDREVAAAELELAETQDQLDLAEARHRGAQHRLDRAKEQLREARELLEREAVAAYVGRLNQLDTAEVLLRARHLGDLAAGRRYVESIAEHQVQVVELHRRRAVEAARLADARDRARSEALAHRQQVVERRHALDVRREELEHLRQESAAQAAAHAELLEQVRARKAAFEERIAALQAESDAIARELLERQSGQDLVAEGSGLLSAPLASPRMSSQFGPREHPIFGTVRMHAGTDFAAATGTPIYAAAAGEVVHAGSRGGYGLTVVIDHSGALATLYAHQSTVAVRVGERVERGQVIGAVGSTGFSTGPHLHFEVRVNGKPVDPLRFL